MHLPRFGGLTGRVLGAGLTLLAVAGIVLGALVLAVQDMRDADVRAERGREVSAVANRLERLVADAETGVRGFIIAGDEDLLRPYRAAQTQIPEAYRELLAAISDREQREAATRIGGSVLAYLEGWVVPLVATTRTEGLAEARELLATSEGRSRLDIIKSRFEQFAATQGSLQRDRDAAASAGARRATLLAYGGFALLAALIVFAAAYASRSIARPVQSLASMARRIQDGDLDVRAPVDGAAEVGRLQERLNEMAEGLGSAVRGLEESNAQLEAQGSERERLVHQVEDRERRYRTLARVGRRLAAETELEPLGHALVDALVDALGAPAAWLHAREGDDGALALVAAHGIDGGDVPERLLPSGPEAARARMETGPYWTAAGAPPRDVLCLPLASGRRLAGLVSLALDRTVDPVRDDLAARLGDQAAIAVGNALSFERARTMAAITQAVIDTGSDAFVSMDGDGLVREWNERAEQMLGFTREEVLGRPLATTIIPERLRAAHRDGLATFLATGQGRVLDGTIEVPALCRDGREIPVELSVSVLHLPDGPRFNAFVRDIGERHAAEEALRASEAAQRALAREQSGLRRVAQAIAEEEETRALFDLVAREAAAILGGDCGLVVRFEGEDAAAAGWFAEGRPEPRRGFALDGTGALATVFATGASARVGDYADIDHDTVGATALRSGYRSSVAAPVRVARRAWGAILVASAEPCAFTAEDERRATELAQLLSLAVAGAERREAVRAADVMKDEFFSLVSHELRTPLTSIVAYLELTLTDEFATLADEHREFLEVVDRNARRLLRLVGDLLFVARINEGRLALERGEVDLQDVVAVAVASAQPRADAGEVTLNAILEPVPAVEGDADRLGQAVDNLISNAIKYTPGGGRVDVRLGADNGDAAIDVVDTGIGIPADEQDHLFQRFFRASTAVEGHVPGVGLGLTIVKAIVEGHDGRLELASAAGRGTTVRILLPTD